MKLLGIDESHLKDNLAHFQRDTLTPRKVLEAMENVWSRLHIEKGLGVQGKAAQDTHAHNFILAGRPFEHDGKIYSKIFNADVYGANAPAPTVGSVESNVAGVPLVWLHPDQGETDVRSWYTNTDASAFGGCVLFNVHKQHAWAALFHEPVHESAPAGGIGTQPVWTYEGYCELFAAEIAKELGIDYGPYREASYVPYATEVQKLIDFTSKEWVAKAYFLNDDEAIGRLCPLFWEKVAPYAIAPSIPPQYIPAVNEVPPVIRDAIQRVTNKAIKTKPAWYVRWVTLYGRSTQMPELPPTPRVVPLAGSGPGMGPGGPGGKPRAPMPAKGPVGPKPGELTGALPPAGWA